MEACLAPVESILLRLFARKEFTRINKKDLLLSFNPLIFALMSSVD
jgi:hypothetical protein